MCVTLNEAITPADTIVTASPALKKATTTGSPDHPSGNAGHKHG
jgi:hypothetical protein